MDRNNIKAVSLLILACLLLSGCAPLSRPEQPAITDYVPLNNTQTLGQSFVADYDGLQSVTIYLQTDSDSNGILKLRLQENPEDQQDIRAANLSLVEAGAPANYQFSFAPINNSNKHQYYLSLELEGSENQVLVAVAPGASYTDGSLYIQGTPQDSQLAFRLQFNTSQVLLGLLIEFLSWIGWLTAAFFLFVPLGWACLLLLWRDWDMHGWIEKTCLAAGVGLAIYPVISLFVHFIGLKPGALIAWLPPLISIGYITWHTIKAGSLKNMRKSVSLSLKKKPAQFLPGVTFLCIVLLIFATRFWNIRAIAIPMWGDSYQHTMISQLFIDNGGLFSSWEPYVPYQSLSVHFGFSLAVALFSWITSIPAIPATLIFGQLINGLAVILLYPWTMRVSHKNQWAACAAVLIAGLITQTPAIYVNWGRYAQLSGQAILPVAFVLLWEVISTNITRTEGISRRARSLKPILSFSWMMLLVFGIVLAGMTLFYYRMPYFLAALVVAWLIAWGLPKLRLDIVRWINLFLALVISGGIAMLLVTPWLYNLVNINASLLSALTPPLESLLANVLADYIAWSHITAFLPAFIISLCGISLVVSVLRKEWVVASLGLWVFFLSLIVAGRLIHLPGTAAMQNFAIVIMLYIPASILAGWLFGEIAQVVSGKWHTSGNILISVFLLVLAMWGSIKTRGVADPNYYSMVNRPDLQAMAWIKENTPAHARFLVEGFRIYGGASAVGSDAGWWIPLLASRQNTMPPQYALLNEVPSPLDYSNRVVDLVSHLETNSPGSIQGVQKLCEEQITYAYIGQVQGLVGSGVQQLYSPEDFLDSPYWRLIYHKDRVHIFELDPSICLQVNPISIQE